MNLKKHFIFVLMVISLLGMVSCHSQRDIVAGGYFGMEMSSDDNLKLYEEIKNWIGVPYRYGGNTSKGVDCSGFVVNVYKNVYGIKLQRSSELIYKKNCDKIKKSKLQEGDLVFFKTGKKKRINHVGIYLKNGKFVHTSTSRGVIISSLDEDYYRKNFMQAGRVRK